MHAVLTSLRMAFAPPHRAGFPFLAAGAIVLLAGLVYHLAVLAAPGALFALFCLYFFRDPERVAPPVPGILCAAADGTITAVGPAVPPAELGMGDEPLLRIATFLSVLDVHVNRWPASGTVVRVDRRAGRFLNASLDKASDENERAAVRLRLDDGREVAVVQIAGLIARRIVNEAVPGAAVRQGERFGIIRFGSRTDLYLPPGATPLVAVGQRAVGGETAMARLE